MKPNNFSNTTTDTLVSPVTPEELADYMSLDYDISDDALLNGFLLPACEMCIDYTNQELLTRAYTYVLDRYPETFEGAGGLGPVSTTLAPWVELPLSPVSVVTGVTLDGVAYTDFTEDLSSIPCRLLFDNPPISGGELAVSYSAGKALSTEIDSRLLLGIKVLAAYMFDNRGCDMSKVIEMSGAAAIWYQNKILIGGL